MDDPRKTAVGPPTVLADSVLPVRDRERPCHPGSPFTTAYHFYLLLDHSFVSPSALPHRVSVISIEPRLLLHHLTAGGRSFGAYMSSGNLSAEREPGPAQTEWQPPGMIKQIATLIAVLPILIPAFILLSLWTLIVGKSAEPE
jgi:hypothetical protein